LRLVHRTSILVHLLTTLFKIQIGEWIFSFSRMKILRGSPEKKHKRLTVKEIVKRLCLKKGENTEGYKLFGMLSAN
jgi:hypothetical protein